MSYRVVKVTTFYRDFLRDYYVKHPEVPALSYDEQYRLLMEQGYGWSDFYARELRKTGVEAFEIVSNAGPLQQAWAREHGLDVAGREIVTEQIKDLRPDVVFLQDSYIFHGEWVTRLRELVPSVKFVIGWVCAPFSDAVLAQFKPFDATFVCSPEFKQRLERFGMQTYELHHAFEPSLLPRIAEQNAYPAVDFIFTGSIISGTGYHDMRQLLLEHLIESKTSIDLYAHIPRISDTDLLMRRSAYIVSRGLEAVGLKHLARTLPFIGKAYGLQEMPGRPKHIEKLLAIAKPPVYGLEMFKALSRSRIGFNNHGEVAGAYAANVRLFEITGVGACMLTDWKKNIGEFFEEDKEVVTYRTAEECVEKVHWLLDHPTACAAIAQAGQARTLRDYTFQRRAAEFDAIVRSELGRYHSFPK
jgi:spore maturation protein CgeB